MRLIPPSGRLDARVAIVGELPGKSELAKGVPFVGSTGHVLDILLHSAGLQRRDCYLTYLIKEFTDSIEDFICYKPPVGKQGKGKKYPYQAAEDVWYNEEYLIWRTALYKELEQTEAKLIIPMGNAALFALTGKWGITRWRGSLLWNDRLGKKVIPTIHPAATFSQYIYQYYIIQDLTKAYEELTTYADQGLPEKQLIINPTFEQAYSYLICCAESEIVGYDIETVRTEKRDNGFVDWEQSCYSLSYEAASGICIPYLDKNGNNYWSPEQELQLNRYLWDRILRNPKVTKVIQNAMFDASFLLKKHGVFIRNIEDTMVAQGIMTPDFEKNLGFLTSIYTREYFYKDTGKQHIKQGGGTWESFQLYSAKDAANLLDIFSKQKAELIKQGNWETYRQQVRLLNPLLLMGYVGSRVDNQMLDASSVALQRQEDDLLLQINRICGEAINPKSPDQLKKYFYEKLRLKPRRDRKSGEVTVNEEALKSIASKDKRPEASLILELRKVAKLRSTYMEVTLDEDSRLRTNFNPVGTKFGRLSSSKTIFETGGNMQNQPPAFKKRIIADPGCVICNIDLAQAENRLVANFAPEPQMLAAFEQGISLHSQTGAMLASAFLQESVAWERVEADDAAYGKSKKEGTDGSQYCAPIGGGTKTWRHWGKTSNHALNYDLGPINFARMMEITTAEGNWIRDAYFQSYPGVRQYHEWVKYELKQGRFLTNPFGRKILLLGRAGDDLYKQGYACLPQSTVADIINRRGLIPIYEEQDKYAPLILQNQVHDSIVVQLQLSRYRLAEIYQSLVWLKESLEQSISYRGRDFIIPAEFELGMSMGELSKVRLDSYDSFAGKLKQVVGE